MNHWIMFWMLVSLALVQTVAAIRDFVNKDTSKGVLGLIYGYALIYACWYLWTGGPR